MASITILKTKGAVQKVDQTMQYANTISIDKSVLAQFGGSGIPSYIMEHINNDDIHLTKEEADKIKDLIASADMGISQVLLNEIYGRIDAKADLVHTHVNDKGFVVTANHVEETFDKKFVSSSQAETWGDKYTKSEVDRMLKELSMTGGTKITEGTTFPSKDVKDGDLFILRTSDAVKLHKYINSTWTYLYNLNGNEGARGEKGETGKAFTYDDFTPEQLAALTGPVGIQGPRGERGIQGLPGEAGKPGENGKSFTYDDFTEEQLAALTGPAGPQGERGPQGIQGPRGERGSVGDALYPSDTLMSSVVNEVGGFKEGDSLKGMTIADIIEKLLCYNESLIEVTPPTFLGTIAYKAIDAINYADLDVITMEKDSFSKGEVMYAHSAGTVLSKSCVVAIPKSFGTITGVYDGTGISLTGSYAWVEKELTVPGAGSIPYIIGGAKKGQIYNNSSIIKWIIA